jgi:HPt (histidine-containing phosphotransfer) domain-containing protein
MGGNHGMYDRLLARFRENQGDALARLRAELAAGDSAAMILRAHTLRGLAGNIGAVTLAQLAGELEEKLRKGTPLGDESVDALLARLDAALPTALSIPPTLPVEAAAPPIPPAPDADGQTKALSTLRQLLTNDDAAAVHFFEGISAWLSRQCDPLLAEQLARQIGRYDFEEASATLQQITRKPRNT